ncbi:MAG: CARDB domain-containing protein [Bryobacteraceae bacterium]
MGEGTCQWAAATSLAWVSLFEASGAGNGNLRIVVAPNLSLLARTGTVTVGGRVLELSQAGGRLSGDQLSETIPDGSVFRPSEQFTKSWLVKNSGEIPWNGVRLLYLPVAATGFTSVNLNPGGNMIPVSDTPPGQNVAIVATMRSPQSPGTYISSWQLQDSQGNLFGSTLTAQIQVVEDSSSTLQIQSLPRYDAVTRGLELEATATDSLLRPVTAGAFEWSLRDSQGVERASGVLRFEPSAQKWMARSVLAAPLQIGRYVVSYVLRSGTKQGRLESTLVVAGGFDIEGRIRNASTNTLLSGVTVSSGGKVGVTDSAGRFYLADLNPSAATTLTAAKTGFTTYQVPLSLQSQNRRLVLQDILMQPLQPNRPVILSLQGADGIIALAGLGTPIYRTFTATVNWNGGSGSVDFFVNGEKKGTATGTATGAQLPIALVVPELGVPFVVRAIAKNREGASSQPADTILHSTPLPDSLGPFKASLRIEQTQNDIVYVLDFHIKGPEKTLNIPLIKEVGGDFSFNGHFDYTASSGAFNTSVGAGTSFEQNVRTLASRLPAGSLSAFRPKRARLRLGSLEIEGNLLIGANGVIRIGQPLVIREANGALSLTGNYPLGRYGLLDIFGPGLSNFVSRVSVLGGVARSTSIDVYLKVGVDGSISLAFSPQLGVREWTAGGRVGLEARYWPEIAPGVSAKITLTGTLGILLQSPGDLFRELRLDGRAAFEYYVRLLALEVGDAFEKTWTWTYPDRAANSVEMAKERLIATAPIRFRPLPTEHLTRGWPTLHLKSSALSKLADKLSSPSVPPEVLVQNVFPYGSLAMAQNHGERMLLYVNDSGRRPFQFSDIYWMRHSGNGWTEPAPVSSDIRDEFAPKVAYDGSGTPIAVWERVKNPEFRELDPDALNKELELVWSRFDRLTGVWTEPQPLTDNDYADEAVQLAGPMQDGGVLAVWSSGRGGELMMWSRWDPQILRWGVPDVIPGVLTPRLSAAFGGRGAKALLAWGADNDFDLDTTEDREIFAVEWDGQWRQPVRITDDSVADDSPRVAVGPQEQARILWLRGKDLVMSEINEVAPTVVRPESSSLGFADYRVTASPAGHLLLLWQDQSSRGPNLYARLLDGRGTVWSQDITLFAESVFARGVAPSWDESDVLTLGFFRIDESQGSPSRTDIALTQRNLTTDLGFGAGGVSIDSRAHVGGGPIQVTVDVRNLGELPVQDATVALYEGDPALGGREVVRQSLSGWLGGQSEATLRFTWNPHQSTGAVDLFAVVDPDERVTESDETNNQLRIRAIGPDLVVVRRFSQVERDGSVRVAVEISNSGSAVAPATRVELRVQDRVLTAAEIPGLAAGESIQVALDAPAGTVPAREIEATVVADPARAIDDLDRSNNELRLFLAR